MKNKKDKKNTLDVRFVEPKRSEAVYVGNELNKYISHVVHIGTDEIDENKVFLYNDIAYRCQYAIVNGKRVLFGIVVLNVNSDESNDGRDIVPDPECDINVIVPVVEAKGFRGFFIMPNGSVVPDYEFAVDAFDDSDDDDIDQFLSGFTSSNPKLN